MRLDTPGGSAHHDKADSFARFVVNYVEGAFLYVGMSLLHRHVFFFDAVKHAHFVAAGEFLTDQFPVVVVEADAVPVANDNVVNRVLRHFGNFVQPFVKRV